MKYPLIAALLLLPTSAFAQNSLEQQRERVEENNRQIREQVNQMQQQMQQQEQTRIMQEQLRLQQQQNDSYERGLRHERD